MPRYLAAVFHNSWLIVQLVSERLVQREQQNVIWVSQEDMTERTHRLLCSNQS